MPLNRMNDVVPSILFKYERPTTSNVGSKILFSTILQQVVHSFKQGSKLGGGGGSETRS